MDRPLRLLHVEDNEDDALLLVRLLEKEGFQLRYHRVQTARAFADAVAREEWDLVISDYALPTFSGAEALALFREAGLDVPFILISGTVGEDIAVSMMKGGAHDYVMKDHLKRLVPAIRRELGEAEVRRQRRLAEARLLLTQYAVDHASQSITWIAQDGTIVYANDVACAQYGGTRETIVGRRLWDVDKASTENRWQTTWLRLKRDKIVLAESEFATPGGAQGFREESISYVEFKREEYAIASSREVTDRKRAEQALRESEHRFRSLFDNAVLGIYQTSPDGSILAANHALCRMLGFSSLEELQTRNLESPGFHPRYDRGEFKRELEAQGAIIGREAEWVKADGTSIFVRENTRVVRDSSGKITYYEGTVEDITERKRAEEQILLSLQEKEVLLKEIHHRVKNNLQVISSLLNLQMNFLKDQQDIELFRDSQNRIRSMGLIHEKLYQSRNLAVIEFGEYLSSLLSHLRRSYSFGEVEITIDAHEVLLDIDIAIPCGLIINELASNALKHAFPDRRKGTVRVSLRSTDPGMYELSVSDDGVGLPPGFDVRSNTSLGLQLVNTLTTQLDGVLEVTDGPGTTFTIRFSGGRKAGDRR